MRKISILGGALIAMLAFSVAFASAASALEWLVEGLKPGGALTAETEGELILKNYEKENELAKLLSESRCSVIFFDTIGPGAVDSVTELLNLAKEAISKTPLSGLALLCDVTFDGGSLVDAGVGAANVELWAVNLPWATELKAGTPNVDVFLNNVGKIPGYYVQETSLLGIASTNECTGGVTQADVENFAGTPASVLGEFLTLPNDSELANCTLTGNLTAEIISPTSGDTWAVEGGRLATAIS